MNDLEYAQLERDLDIDRNGLDEEVVRQPRFFQKVAEAYADAVSIRDGCKDTVKREEAAAQLRAATTGDKKPTELVIKAMAETDPRVVEAKANLVAAAREAQRLEDLKEAYKERGYALKTLSQLWSDGYWQSNAVRTQPRAQDRQVTQNREAMAQARLAAGYNPTEPAFTGADKLVNRRPRIVE